MLAEDLDADIPPVLLQPALPEPLRQYVGRLHPSGMGGEYLPDLSPKRSRLHASRSHQPLRTLPASMHGRPKTASSCVSSMNMTAARCHQKRPQIPRATSGRVDQVLPEQMEPARSPADELRGARGIRPKRCCLFPGKLRLLSRVRRLASIPRPKMAQAAMGLWNCRTRQICNAARHLIFNLCAEASA